ncbi:MAG: hypothetical protein IT168_02600 [Bryobacterales bacterium]|nr:hypothetical protein [Bryobacterales bacterium]
MEYSSFVTHRSNEVDGVSFTVKKMSLGGRLDLAKRIRQIGIRREFHNAGGNLEDELEVGIIENEINRAYLEWGVTGIDGLMIDGEAATVETVIHHGPERLTGEMLAAVRAELSLSEEERKN